MKHLKKSTLLKGTAGGTAAAGLLAGIIAPAVELNKVQEENEKLKRQLREAQETQLIPVPAPVETQSEELANLKEELRMERDWTEKLETWLESEYSKNTALKDFLKQNDDEIASLTQQTKDLQEQIKSKDKWIKIKKQLIKQLQKKVKDSKKQNKRTKKSLTLFDTLQANNPLTYPSGCWLSLDNEDTNKATSVGVHCTDGWYYNNGKKAPGAITFWAKKEEHKESFNYLFKLYKIHGNGTKA